MNTNRIFANQIKITGDPRLDVIESGEIAFDDRPTTCKKKTYQTTNIIKLTVLTDAADLVNEAIGRVYPKICK